MSDSRSYPERAHPVEVTSLDRMELNVSRLLQDMDRAVEALTELGLAQMATGLVRPWRLRLAAVHDELDAAVRAADVEEERRQAQEARARHAG